MKIFLNIMGVVMTLIAANFGVSAVQLISKVQEIAAQPENGLAAAYAGNIFQNNVELTLLALIGMGVFFGAGAILAAIERRATPADDELTTGGF